MLSGEVVFVTDGGEQVLREGQCAGYPAGARGAPYASRRSSGRYPAAS